MRSFFSFKNKKKVLGYTGVTISSLFLVIWGQNCAQTKFENASSGEYQSVGFDVTEDDLFYKIQNGLATVAELAYSKDRYKAYIELKVSDINSSGGKSNQAGENSEVMIQDVMSALTEDINRNVTELKDLIFNQKMATNSKEVLKKYSELLDLLARARDINNFLILKADLGEVRTDIAKLRTDFNALQASLQEVRTQILPAMKAELSKKISSVEEQLKADAERRDAALRVALTETEQRLLVEIREKEQALRSELNTAQQQILERMKAGNKALMDELNAKHSNLLDMMSQQDRELRDQLNQKYQALKGQLSASEIAQRDLLNSRFAEAMSKMSAQDLALRDQLNRDYATLTSNLDQTKQNLVKQIVDGDNAVRREFDVKLANMKAALVHKIESTERLVNDRISGVEALSRSSLAQIRDIQGIIANIDQRVRDTSHQLRLLSDKVSDDIKTIHDQFEAIRTAGNLNYAEMVKSWNCSEDMLDKHGFQFYGLDSSASLGVSVSQACLTSKEKVLYSICKERYPTFCGACEGYSDPEMCPAWTDMSGKDRLEILMNIRQEVAINYLNEQSRIQSEALYGGASCNAQCLNQLSDPAVQSVVGQLFAGGSGSGASCSADEWKKCGLYGVAYSLAVNDTNLTSKILAVNNNLSTDLAKLRVDFEKEKKSVASRFGLLESEINEKVEVLKRTTESRFMEVASSMAGLSSGSGGPTAVEMAQKSAELAAAAQKRIGDKEKLIQAIAIAMNKSTDVARASLGGIEDDVIEVLSSGAGAASFNVVTEFLKTLDPNQFSIPDYDKDLFARASNKCAGAINQPIPVVNSTTSVVTSVRSPFTNIAGRDSGELLAVGYLRLLLTGERSSVAKNNEIFFSSAGIVKSSDMHQQIIGRLFDYRRDPSVSLPEGCLDTIDAWAKDWLLSKSEMATRRAKLVQNLTLERMTNLLIEDSKKVLSHVGSMEGLIVGTAGADIVNMAAHKTTIANLLAQAAISQRIYTLLSQEVETMIALQKELSEANGFQSQFRDYLLQYRDSMAKFQAGQNDLVAKMQAEIAALKQASGAQAAQLTQVKDAMGYVAALAQTDPLATQGLKDKVVAAANVDASIKQLIDQINNSGRTNAEVPFTPSITAIRHIANGNANCFGTQPGAGQLSVSGNSFVAGYGVGSGCWIDLRQVNAINTYVFRIWGSAHKINFKDRNNKVFPVDYRSPASTGEIKRIVDGGVKLGVFESMVPNLMKAEYDAGWSEYRQGTIRMTPVYVAANGTETTGTEKSYTMTLYSPLVLDFVSKGMPQTLDSTSSNVRFDITASGVKMNVGWISGQQGALLALDLNNNGRIESGAELFGEFTTVQKTGKMAKNGYEALAQYDANLDGKINVQDPIFKELKLWFDNNANGVAEKGELKTLTDMQVTDISVKYKKVAKNKQDNNGNKIPYQAKFFGPEQCGKKGCNSYDIYFGTTWTDKIPMYLSANGQ